MVEQEASTAAKSNAESQVRVDTLFVVLAGITEPQFFKTRERLQIIRVTKRIGKRNLATGLSRENQMQIVAFTLIVIGCTLSLGCGGGQTTEYKEYSLDEGRFRFQFPTDLKPEFESYVSNANGKYGKRDNEFFIVQDGKAGYGAGFCKFNMPPDQFSEEEFFKSTEFGRDFGKIEIQKTKRFYEYGFPTQLVLAVAGEQKMLFHRFVDKERLSMYVVMTFADRGEDLEDTQDKSNLFLNSVVIE